MLVPTQPSMYKEYKMSILDFSVNPFEDADKVAECDALMERGRGILENQPEVISGLMDTYPFVMSLAKLLAAGTKIPRSTDMMVLVSLILAAIEIRDEDTTIDDTARKLLDY